MTKEKTTELVLLKDGAPFTWGKVVKIHTIGRFDFVEYLSWTALGPPLFAIYVDGKDKHTSSQSIEEALISAVAFSRLEVNEARWMTSAACKLLGIR